MERTLLSLRRLRPWHWSVVVGGAAIAAFIPLLEMHFFRNGMGVNTGVMLPYLLLRALVALKPMTVCIALPLIYAVPVGFSILLWCVNRKAGAISSAVLAVLYLASTALVWRLPLD